MKKLINILLVLALLAGLSLLLYPTVSDYWNSLHASQAVASYDEAVQSMDAGRYDALLQSAQRYNRDLFSRGSLFSLTDEQREDYLSQLSIDTSGIMGYIEIPTIKVSLPIYHGTSDDVLQIAVGHLEWSSLPVGGESTHCVLSGLRGLPSAKLFTNLDQLSEGDLFVIRTLDEVLTYEVDRILIVLPGEVQTLGIEEGKDLCTLVTCTPRRQFSPYACARPPRRQPVRGCTPDSRRDPHRSAACRAHRRCPASAGASSAAGCYAEEKAPELKIICRRNRYAKLDKTSLCASSRAFVPRRAASRAGIRCGRDRHGPRCAPHHRIPARRGTGSVCPV